jgi:hypothetical protein
MGDSHIRSGALTPNKPSAFAITCFVAAQSVARDEWSADGASPLIGKTRQSL